MNGKGKLLIEILSFEGCPNAQIARDRVIEALRLEHTTAVVKAIGVETVERAQQMRFLGSPSVRVNGRDVEADDSNESYGLMCRTYHANAQLEGAPAVNLIRAAIRSARESRDILRSRVVASTVFLFPALALVISGSLAVDPILHTAIWVGALVIMGVGCIANAWRCGRVHCFFTGPFFLAVAILTLLYGLGLASLGSHGWSVISLILVIGTVILYCLPEAFFGRYWRKL